MSWSDLNGSSEVSEASEDGEGQQDGLLSEDQDSGDSGSDESDRHSNDSHHAHLSSLARHSTHAAQNSEHSGPSKVRLKAKHAQSPCALSQQREEREASRPMQHQDEDDDDDGAANHTLDTRPNGAGLSSLGDQREHMDDSDARDAMDALDGPDGMDFDMGSMGSRGEGPGSGDVVEFLAKLQGEAQAQFTHCNGIPSAAPPDDIHGSSSSHQRATTFLSNLADFARSLR